MVQTLGFRLLGSGFGVPGSGSKLGTHGVCEREGNAFQFVAEGVEQHQPHFLLVGG
jgi:hypothetical protein